MARATRSRRHAGVLLTWALDRDGLPVRVAELDRRRQAERAPLRCLACGEELVARLGEIRAHHFAHLPGSACTLTRPETVIHFEAKQRLLFLCGEAFARRLRVRLAARCPSCRRELRLDLTSVGDAASAEVAAGPVRPDVLVTRGGAPSLAFEVRVAHAVDGEKREALARMSLWTLEIDAREAWEEASAGEVLLRVARTLGGPSCGACQAASRADAGRALGGEAAAVAELESYRARGLLGARPGAAWTTTDPLSRKERDHLAARFRCPECGGGTLVFGDRLAQHACAGGLRPVAWRGYDGALVELGWWRQA